MDSTAWTMARIWRLSFLLILLTLSLPVALAQTDSVTVCGREANLVVNSGFERTTKYPYDVRRYRDTFPVDSWYEVTAGTVDIMRDYTACDTNHVYSIQSAQNECVACRSGSYCVAIGLMDPLGSVEHISGQLVEPLTRGHEYEVTFWLKKTHSNCSVTPLGFGLLITADSIALDGASRWDDRVNRLSPNYMNLFAENPLYANYEASLCPGDTSWHRHSFIYEAEGGERYLTFGRFAYGGEGGSPTNAEVLAYLKMVNKKPYQDRVMRITLKNKHGLFYIDPERPCLDEESVFYLLDDVSVRPVKAIRQ